MRGTGSLPTDLAGWAEFFARFEDVVLIANSDAVDIAKLRARFGTATLFVFFNKTYKVLAGPFDGTALLVARSSEAGANIVYRREVEDVLRPFVGAGFKGVVNLRADAKETFSRPSEFGDRPVGFLDLAEAFADVYPAGRVATSGFALGVWLAERRLPARLHLAGFSARRSDRWKLFRDHDWTFEQTALRLLHRARLLDLTEDPAVPRSLSLLAERFPEIAAEDAARTAIEVLGERLENAETAVDRLFSLTRWQGRLDRAVRALKPKTRKRKLAEAGGAGADGLAKNPGGD
jgi:hypothetical protein